MNDLQSFLAGRLQERHLLHKPFAPLELLANVGRVIESHEDFVEQFLRLEFDFVYDLKTGLYLADVRGTHVKLMAALYAYWTGDEFDEHQAADLYVMRGWGMLKSRAGHSIYRGESFVVPHELARVSRDIEVLQ